VEDDLLKFKLSIRMGKNGVLSDFECGVVVGATRIVWVYQKLLIYWEFHTQSSPGPGFTENGPKTENIQWVSVMWVKMHCWCQRSEKNGQTGSSR